MANISVIVPTYNRAGMIRETLDAILSQTLPPDEVIVVDDGSLDDTHAVLAVYGARVKTVRIPNSGDLVARNVGVKAATGRFVAFCDSDDLWTPDFLDTMTAQWRAEPTLQACYCDFHVIEAGHISNRSKFEDAPAEFWHDSRMTGQGLLLFDKGLLIRLLAFQPLFPSCLMVDRMAFMSQGGWDEGVSRILGCDFATALRLAASPGLGILRRPLAMIRKHASNISANIEATNLGDARVLEYVLRTRPELEAISGPIVASMARRRRAALDSAFSRHDFSGVRDIGQLIPARHMSAKTVAKRLIAGLPVSLATGMAGLLSH